MKYLFAVVLSGLVVASIVTYRMNPEMRRDVPVLYWVTDPNPARVEQVEIFHRWLEKQGHPRFELKVDTVNFASDKVVIQGVSGVCGDIIGHCGGPNMRFRQAVGILDDITDIGLDLDFSPSRTYAAMEPEITVDGRQYAFPCNVYAHMLWVNEETFRKHGIDVPSRRWTFDEFETAGRRFVRAANTPGEARKFFFCNRVDDLQMVRSLGVSLFNETLTRCSLDDPRTVRALERRYTWTYEDHIIPSLADIQSFSSEHGYGGLTLQLFNSGNYAMFQMGRYALIQLRQFGHLKLAVVEPPHGGFPNTATGTRAAAIYRGGQNRDLAKYFLAYLASEDYNMQIVRDADALPPNPAFTKTEAYLKPLPLLPDLSDFFPYAEDEADTEVAFRDAFYGVTDTVDRDSELKAANFPPPPKPAAMSEAAYNEALDRFRTAYDALVAAYREEWDCHKPFTDALEQIAIPRESSPFILDAVAARLHTESVDGYMSDLYSAEEAAARVAERIHAEMARTLKEDPSLQKLYDERLAIQTKIDARRRQGRPVPPDWIKNPFHRKYYAEMGWLE